ncbi:MAG TPA: alpha/beta hydrolase [Polyangiaceae bacterium]|nr:alpha/beta hydrolase [Polyangiaceae bacterium]
MVMETTDRVIDGVRCAVFDSEPGGRAEAVVFVHGNPGPMDDWEVLAPAASAFARAIAMDLPGYGRADHPRDFDYTVPGYARYLGALLDRLGVRRAHLVLHDFGGGFGLWWGLHNPERFASVTLINTGALKGYRWHYLAKIWQTPILGELFQLTTTASMFRSALNRDNPKPMPDAFVERVMRYADWGHRRAVLALYRATRDPERYFGSLQPKLRELDRPACVVWGAEDKYLPARFAHQQLETFPRAEIHVLPGLGHWPFVDDPDAVQRIVIPFLQRQVSQ